MGIRSNSQYPTERPEVYAIFRLGEKMVDYPQVNIKLLSEEDRELVEVGKKRAEELRLTFKDFLLDCLRKALADYDASENAATKRDVQLLNDKIKLLEDKVNHPAVGRGELLTIHERLNQLRSGFWNEIKKDRSQLGELSLAIAKLESCIEQLMPLENTATDEVGLENNDDWLFESGEVGVEDVEGF